MTKKELIRHLAEQYGLNQDDVRNIVQGTLDTIIREIQDNGRAEIRNFGIFEVRTRKARRARNPRTGEAIQVPAKKTVVFKPGLLLRRAIGEKD